MFFIDLTGASFYECLISRNGLFAIWKQYLPFRFPEQSWMRKRGNVWENQANWKNTVFGESFECLIKRHDPVDGWSTLWKTPLVVSMPQLLVEIWENLNVIKGSSMMVSMTVASLAEDLTVTYFGFCAGSLFCIYHFLFWSLFVLITFCIWSLFWGWRSHQWHFNLVSIRHRGITPYGTVATGVTPYGRSYTSTSILILWAQLCSFLVNLVNPTPHYSILASLHLADSTHRHRNILFISFFASLHGRYQAAKIIRIAFIKNQPQ